MFDKTFFGFAIGFAAIILVGVAGLVASGYFEAEGVAGQSASVPR